MTLAAVPRLRPTFRQLHPGDELTRWDGRRELIKEGESGLCVSCKGESVCYLWWEVYAPATGPCSYEHPQTPYLYLYSAWTHPHYRGRGLFTHAAEYMHTRNPLPVETLTNKDVVERFCVRTHEALACAQAA